MTNILIIENDPDLSELISSYFSNKDYNCRVRKSIEGACELIERMDFELVILDRVLDDGDGLEVAQFIQDFNFKIRVLVLSQKSTVNERIIGLENGADDYLAKPFSISELNLRVSNLLAKEKLSENFSLTLGPITIYPKTGEVKLNEKMRVMRKKELAILTCLFKHKNHAVSKEMIINDVWSSGANLPTHSTLDVYIRRIRVFLGKEKSLIKTIRGFGYMASS